MARWAKRWYWREMREAERDSGLQHHLVFSSLRPWQNILGESLDIVEGVDTATNEDATVWTAHFRNSLTGLTTRVTPGPAIIIRPPACNCGASDSEYPNQHSRACPQFKTNFCHCPPATGPGQPHRDDCSQYKRERPELQTDSYFGVSRMRPIGFGLLYGSSKAYQSKLSVAQLQAYNVAYNAWLATQPRPIECTCAARSGVIGHARFCPLGDGTASRSFSFGRASAGSL